MTIDLSKAEIGSKWKTRDGRRAFYQGKSVVTGYPHRIALETGSEYTAKNNGQRLDGREDDVDIIAPWPEDLSHVPPSEWRAGDVVECVEACGPLNLGRHTIAFIEQGFFDADKPAIGLSGLDKQPAWHPSRFRLVRRAEENKGCDHCGEAPATEKLSEALSYCADCLKKSQKGFEQDWNKHAQKIEQRPICACCTQFIGADVRHDDPCVYAHTERYMTQSEKRMFRERRKASEETDRIARKREKDLYEMGKVEGFLSPHYRGMAAHDYKAFVSSDNHLLFGTKDGDIIRINDGYCIESKFWSKS